MRSCDGTRHATLASASASVERGSGSDLGTAGVPPEAFLARRSGSQNPGPNPDFGSAQVVVSWVCHTSECGFGFGFWVVAKGGWVCERRGKIQNRMAFCWVFLCRIPHQGRRRCGLGHHGRRIRVCWVLFSRTRVDGLGHQGRRMHQGESTRIRF